jgi:hypothetical protein
MQKRLCERSCLRESNRSRYRDYWAATGCRTTFAFFVKREERREPVLRWMMPFFTVRPSNWSTRGRAVCSREASPAAAASSTSRMLLRSTDRTARLRMRLFSLVMTRFFADFTFAIADRFLPVQLNKPYPHARWRECRREHLSKTGEAVKGNLRSRGTKEQKYNVLHNSIMQGKTFVYYPNRRLGGILAAIAPQG